jgi:RNA polymerase sigma-70 factor (ECF subfamily)
MVKRARGTLRAKSGARMTEEPEPIHDVPPTRAEKKLLERLRGGDEAAFTELVDKHHGPMRRLARTFVSSDAVADEVVQETWLAVLEGLARFEGRSSLKTWIYRVLVNRAKTRGIREGRSSPMSSFDADDDASGGGRVDPSRFDKKGMWSAPPTPWETPEAASLLKESAGMLHVALEHLPVRQRTVLVLRDVEGWTSEEVCNVLGLNETNQRVMLHRARTRLRNELEQYVKGSR